ncbi:hypothetical protein STAS_07196 [Striga asiatica]|uniref:Uncharacterized protein n=1 Tax=Striga asiatica TaxID=4170 RepID=A0A5A7PE45_STRAF|nr:hypothetical protein STAS_07196 [Striga asiatica]
MVSKLVFTDEEMAVDEGLGYPKAFAKLCRDPGFGPFSHGPPFAFNPYALGQQEDSKVKELEELFPIIDPKAKPTAKPKIFLSLLWKQLNHLGNAGFDPEVIRVDSYGNVLYYHADAASPLAWDIDHCFPCSRGGLTVPSNLRILQWQVCKRKHDKLEFLIPWWDFQIGISINQFLSIFASSNADFRRRAFSWLFSEGESEELNSSQTVESHVFPQHFLESKGKLGLAAAGLVLSRRESSDAPLKSLDLNRRPRSTIPIVAALKKTKHYPDENENAIMAVNLYQAIALARDSLKQREETAKMHAEIQKLDNEVCELQQKTEEEKVSIQELELVLMKKRRRAEKCRRLAESQCSYRTMLEKMIRDAMHQSVVYKEQVRLNQAAASALLARLEAQKAICDSAERELHMKYKQRDELEKQIRPEWEQARKRSRMNDTTLIEDDTAALCLMENKQEMETNDTKKDILYLSEHKELRKFLEEEQSPTGADFVEGPPEEGKEKNNNSFRILQPGKNDDKNDNEEKGYIIEERLEKLEIENGGKIFNIQFPLYKETEDEEEDEESRRLRGKGNIEKWLQFLLENTPEDDDPKTNTVKGKDENRATTRTDEFIEKLNLVYPHRDIKLLKAPKKEEKTDGGKQLGTNTPLGKKNPPYRIAPENIKEKELVATGKESRRMSSPDVSVVKGKVGKEKELSRSESARAFRRIPSSPSLILNSMKNRVDCMRKKPLVLDDNSIAEDYASRSSFIKTSIKTLKRAVRI